MIFQAINIATLMIIYSAQRVLSTSLSTRQWNQCNPGQIYCCNNVMSSTSPTAVQLFTLLGIPPPSPVSAYNPLVGLNCAPMVPYIASPLCGTDPICCQNQVSNGLFVYNFRPLVF
ncbi:hypothetical protein BJ165DRAFT_1423510 [Panaeolus papilionaceus]|nr:hypothetical protein BJ165DRAFT_1423510 [Panaeolus papilionaceus]